MPTKTQTVRITLNPKAGTPENCIFVGKAIVKGKGNLDVEMAMESTSKMFKNWGADPKTDKERKPFFRPLSRGEEILIKYIWETTEDGKFTSPVFEEQRQVLDFLRAMPLVEVKGSVSQNKKTNAPFLLEILEETTVSKISSFAKVLSARNIINEMPLEKRRDVAYYYGRDVSKKNDDEVLILLAGEAKTPMEGFLLMDENVDEFIVLAKKIESENQDVYLKTLLNKAISAKLIMLKDGNYQTSAGDFIGLSENEAILYLKDRKTYTDSIKKEISILFNESVSKSVEDSLKIKEGLNPLEGTESLDNIDQPNFNPLNLSKADMKKFAKIKNLPAASVTNDPEKIELKVRDWMQANNVLIH